MEDRTTNILILCLNFDLLLLIGVVVENAGGILVKLVEQVLCPPRNVAEPRHGPLVEETRSNNTMLL